MYKFIKSYEDYLLHTIADLNIYVHDGTNGIYFIFNKKMDVVNKITQAGRNVNVTVLGNYLFWVGHTLGETRIYTKDGENVLKELDFRIRVRQNFHNPNDKNPSFLFFSNNDCLYYQITPETWEVEKIPYPDSNQYYYTSFGKYIVFKNEEEQWFVYESNLNNLVWSGDYAWASTFEHKGKIHRYWNFGVYPYGEDRMILVYSPCHAFCINLITKEVEWQNKITGKYMVVGDIAYNHLGGERIATIDLQTGAIINKKKAVDKLSPMSRYVRKYAPAPNAGVTYHDGLLWGMADEGKEAFIGAYDPDTYQLQWSTQLPGVGEIPQQLFFLEDYMYVRCHFGNLYVYQKEKSLNLKS